MSETETPDPWRGWYGPPDLVAAAKAEMELLFGANPPGVGVIVPESGQPPAPVDVAGVHAMFAFSSALPLEPPPGLFEARPEIVHHLIGTRV